jgi:hypothetical protein
MNIQGKPSRVYADCGTQIKAANGTLKALNKALHLPQLRNDGASNGITFVFTQPGSPWQNGCSEALIKSIKRSLNCLTGSDSPRLAVLQLQRVLTSIANLLNDRPIGKHPKSADDGKLLCPNDLLLGRSSDAVLQHTWPELDGKHRKYIKQLLFCERIVNDWFSRWRRLYFHTLIPEKKWHVDSRQVRVGDLVLIKDLNLVRGQWKRGEVTKIFSSSDGKVRSVQLKYKILDPRKQFDSYNGSRFSIETRDVKNLVVILPVEER